MTPDEKRRRKQVCSRVNRGEEALAVDLLFTGDMSIAKRPGNVGYTQCLSAMGERPFGIEVAQLIAIAEWMKSLSPRRTIRLESTGMRSEMVALAAAALKPGLFSELLVGGRDSLATPASGCAGRISAGAGSVLPGFIAKLRCARAGQDVGAHKDRLEVRAEEPRR